MAHTAYFKFPATAVDTLPAELSGETDSATFKTLLASLYTNEGGVDACGQGKAIFLNTADGINAAVVLVNLLVIQYDGVAEGEHKLVFHLNDISESFQIVP